MQTYGLFLIMGVIASAGLAIVAYLMRRIGAYKVDNADAQRIADAIRSGAMTFLKEEYKIIALVVAAGALLLAYFSAPLIAACFVMGAILSLTTGFIGMRAATMANVRTTMAARDGGERAAFQVAFLGGGVMGFSVASIGLLGLGVLVYLVKDYANFDGNLSKLWLGCIIGCIFCSCWRRYFYQICRRWC